jgi:hypothetical protein
MPSSQLLKNIQTAICIFLTGIALSAPAAKAQVLYGSLLGNVTDPAGVAMPGVACTLTNTATGKSSKVETDDTGLYQFRNLVGGSYDLQLSKSGFAVTARKGILLTINNVSRLDLAMQLGSVSESVQVSAQSTALQTDRAEVRHEVNARTLENVPMPPGRNYQQSLILLPGFTPPSNQNSEVANPSRSLSYNSNGTSRSSNNIRVDGTGTNGIWIPQNASYIPALESIETVSVVTNSFDAEQGLAGGSEVNVQIKSGTNALHGSAFEFHNDNSLQAKRFFQPVGKAKSKTIFNQFGGTLGGPIKRDKLFYFASYERSADHRGQDGLATVPTAAIRAGDLSGSTVPIYDPATGAADGGGRTPFPGYIIPPARMDPIAVKLAKMTPLPNYGGNALTNNYYSSWPYAFDRNTLDTKVNWNPSERLTLFGRFSFLEYNMNQRAVLGDLSGDRTSGTGFSTSTSIGGTFVVSPRFVVDGNFGWNVMNTDAKQNRVGENIGSDTLGIPGTNGSKEIQSGWPGFIIPSYTTLGYSGGVTPIKYHDLAFQYTGNASYTIGTHNIRFGVDLSRQHLNHTTHELVGASGSAQGTFSFGGGITGLNGGPTTNQYNSYGSFLLGLASAVNKIVEVPDTVTGRAWLESFYVRDQWQASRKLTISYGTRWEYYPIPTRADRGFERYDFNNNKMLICGVGPNPIDCGVKVSKSLFAPRLGFAYRPTETTVIRAGYGITIDPYSLTRPMRTNYPVLVALNLSGPSTYQPAGLLKDGIPPIAIPNLSSGVIDVPSFVVVNSLGDKVERGYIQSWNLTLQRTLPFGFTGQAGYVATRQVRQLGFREMNAGEPGGGAASRQLFKKFGRSTSTQLITPLGTGHYDSLQSTLERRFSRGFQAQLSYTFSKATGICCNDNSDALPAIQLPQYYNLNRAVTGYDRTHTLAINSILQLPFGKGKKWLGEGLMSKLAGGWTINSLTSRFSGLPFSVTSAATSLNAPGNTQRADQVKGSVDILGGTGPGQSYFDPKAFAPVTAARFGTAGFNTLRGPGVINIDLGLFREFAIKEHFKLQFRAEAFNVTNTPHFDLPGNNVSNLQLNGDGSIRSLGGFTEITATRTSGAREGVDERAVRLGLRLSF